MPAEIKQCSCKNEYQDRTYGSGKRVHNQAPSRPAAGQSVKFRCTVCGVEKS